MREGERERERERERKRETDEKRRNIHHTFDDRHLQFNQL